MGPVSCSQRRPAPQGPPGHEAVTWPSRSLITGLRPIIIQSTTLHSYNLYNIIRNFSPHLRNSAILRTTKSIAELRTKKICETAIADLHNLTSAILQLCAVSGQFHYFLVSSPFSSAQDGFKKQPTLFLEPFVSLENKNLP